MGRATVSLSEDKLALTVLYSAFVSSAGPGIDVLEARKACDLDIGLEFPPGFTFTVIKLDTRGFVSARFRGPADRNYVQSRAFPAHERVASPCSPAGKDLLVTHEAEVTAPEGTQGLLSVDSSDLSVKQVFHLQWRRCE
ncbi:hypothetical protein DFJ74DRAFT_703428 [Hyaloraphidium curvatum]|nr:hypothetical protein DFJ74DRAFT_703428 [Hyaloraphidium curvatum]